MTRRHAKATKDRKVIDQPGQRSRIAEHKKEGEQSHAEPKPTYGFLLRGYQTERGEDQGEQAYITSEFSLVVVAKIRQRPGFRQAAEDVGKDHRQRLPRRKRVGDKILEAITGAKALVEKFGGRHNLHRSQSCAQDQHQQRRRVISQTAYRRGPSAHDGVSRTQDRRVKKDLGLASEKAKRDAYASRRQPGGAQSGA